MAYRELPVPTEEIAAARAFIGTTLGIHEDDPLIGLPQIAQLAGVAPGTSVMWQQRSRDSYKGPGKLTGKKRFPDADDTRYADKPQWRAISTVLTWLWKTGRWPRGAVARPETRREAQAA